MKLEYMINHFCLRRQYHTLKDELLNATNHAMREGLLVDGSFTRNFEQWLVQKTNAKYALACHSGTQALEFIAKYHYNKYYEKFNKKPVIKIPNLTYVATLNAFINAGYDIKILDTDDNALMIEDEYSPEEGVCIIGLYGAKPKTYGTGQHIRIHDGAQHWLNCDTLDGGMAISFDPTKNLPSSGNGGAVVTNDEELYKYVFAARNNGAIKGIYGGNVVPGTNSKMSEIEAAHLLVRSRYIDQWQDRRQSIAKYYCEQFANIPELRVLSNGVDKHQYQKFVIYTTYRNELEKYLRDSRIDTRVNYREGLNELPIAAPYQKPNMDSNSIKLSRGVIYYELLDTEVEYIAEKVREFFTSSH
jgi:dTDP-4-amino-4,6-dideoxygalactose transaminase